MNILISGSLAYDRIMDFQGKFSDFILPDKIHNINVCFMINTLREYYGGTAGNIAYTLSLLGEKPIIIATAGRDFESYRQHLKKHNIPDNGILIIEDELTAGAYITTDQGDNQITTFNPGAMKYSARFDFDSVEPQDTIAIVAPGNLDDMLNFTRSYKAKGIRYLFDPGQSLPVWDKNNLIEAIDQAWLLISNDYELELIKEKTGLKTEDLLKKVAYALTTKGEQGAVIMALSESGIKSVSIPAAPVQAVNDPTGAGDAFRGGLLKGLSDKLDIQQAARYGAVCAAYCVEVFGPQNFHYTLVDYQRRFDKVNGISG
jgi:adenosine kinase